MADASESSPDDVVQSSSSSSSRTPPTSAQPRPTSDDQLEAEAEASQNPPGSIPPSFPTPITDSVDMYWDRLRQMFAQSKWFQHVDEILVGNKVLDLVSKRLVRPAEFFFGSAAECFLEHNTVDDYLAALKERMGATWDDRLTQPARVFFATASSAQKICGAGRFFGGMIQLGRQTVTCVVNDISDRFDKLVLVTEAKLYRMFTYGSDESKGGDEAAAGAGQGDGSSSGSFSRSPISITFNEFMKLARLAKVQQPQPNDRRGRGHSIDDIILKRSRSIPDLDEDGSVPVASTGAAAEAARNDEHHMSDENEHESDRMDRTMTRSQLPLCSDSDDSESHSSDCEDETLYGDDELALSSSSSFSSSSSSHDRFRRVQMHQQQQRLRRKSMSPAALSQSPSSKHAPRSEPLKRRRPASVDGGSMPISHHLSAPDAKDVQVDDLARSLEHILSLSHSHLSSPGGVPFASNSAPSAPPTIVEDGGDVHTGRRTRQKRGPVSGYLSELGQAFKRDLMESQWFEKTNEVLLENDILRQLGHTMGNTQAAQFLGETAAEVFLALPVDRHATSTLLRLGASAQNASGDAFALRVRERLGTAWDPRLSGLVAFFFQRAVQRSSEAGDTVSGDVSSSAAAAAFASPRA